MNQVEEEESFSPALEEEAFEVECLLVEPPNDHVSVEGILCFHQENEEKCMESEDVPCRFGRPDSTATGKGKDLLKFKLLDAIPHEVEVGNFQGANGVSTTCDDYLLDIGFAESVTNLDYNSSEGLHLRNSGSESQISRISSGDNGTLGIPDSSTTITPGSECQNNLLDKTVCELHGNLSYKYKSETSIEAEWLKGPTSSESTYVDKSGDVSNLLARGISSDRSKKDVVFPPGVSSSGMSCSSKIVENNEVRPVGHGVEIERLRGQEVLTKICVQDSNAGALLTQKRLRKPTRRYIDESSDLNSRYCSKRQEISTSTSKDKFLGVRSLKHRHMGARATLTSEDSFGKAIQVPFDSQVRKEFRKKRASIAVQKSVERSPTASEDGSITTVRAAEIGDQRKHHRMWTLSEVRKLIDGVSHYGVGRWTQIKRLLFSSSAHRTPVDLKDKWRNLLKASCAQKQSKSEDEQKRNQPWRPLPKSMLHRVSELAIIYPYPRNKRSKLSHAHHVPYLISPAQKLRHLTLSQRENCA